jgi:membrane protein YqaA with SNARE-associated domain
MDVGMLDSGAAWLDGLVSVGYGLLSAVVPLANAEAYVAAARAAGLNFGFLVAIAVSIGQTMGKAILFLSVRHGRNLPYFTRRAAADKPPRWPRLRAFADRLLTLVGSPWGVPITLLGAIIGIPPIYPLALVAGATRMPLSLFCIAVFVGRCVRFGLLTIGVDAGITGLLQLSGG